MSYLRKFEYQVIPEESYTVLRHCPICGTKSTYINSNNFRVNANGNRIDVWLIYHCRKCKYTYNLTIFERLQKDALSQQQYKNFMENDKELAMKYGVDKSIFAKNKAEIDKNGMRYQTQLKTSPTLDPDEPINFREGDSIELENPCSLKLRPDKILAEILNISRSKAVQLEEAGIITLMNDPGQNLEVLIHGDINNTGNK